VDLNPPCHLPALPLCRCGATRGPLTNEVAASYTLPPGREATADEKKRSAVIYAEVLRRALAQPHVTAGRSGGRG
jgi:hypothetical protein